MSRKEMIATKGGFVRGGREFSTVDAIGNRNYLRQCAYLSARRLGVDQLDLYYLHSGRATDVPFEDQVGTLAELRKEGMIRHIGLSNVTKDQLRAALQITEIAAVTAYFNVAARHQATIPQVTLAWLLARSPAVMPIPATTTLGHLRENLAAEDLELTDEDIRSIDGLA